MQIAFGTGDIRHSRPLSAAGTNATRAGMVLFNEVAFLVTGLGSAEG